jgi:hypothetical protein
MTRWLPLLSLFYAAPALAGAAPVSSLREVPWKDRFYEIGAAGAGVTVKGGIYEATGYEDDGFISFFAVVEVLFGDLTGDGVEEAVVLTRAGTVTGYPSQVDVYELRGGAPALLGTAPTKDYVSALSLSGKKITVETENAAQMLTCGFVPNREKPKREAFVVKGGRVVREAAPKAPPTPPKR